jgi:SOS-response transcriptional repressor LexA
MGYPITDIKSTGNHILANVSLYSAEMLPVTETGRRLKALLDASPKYNGNAKALSLDAGLGETAVTDIISGRSRRPRRYTLRQIAEQLGCMVEDIESVDRPVKATGIVSASPGRPPVRRGEMIPIRSAGRGGSEQEMFEDNIVGYTQRPGNLGGVREAYAVYMLGDSMQPRYYPGWLLHINPFKPPSRGRDVVVFKNDNSVLIKQFVEQNVRELVLEQLNPSEEIRIPLAEVREIHLIVGSDQEGG